jgi:endo-1,4-beta-D-glucanase Y
VPFGTAVLSSCVMRMPLMRPFRLALVFACVQSAGCQDDTSAGGGTGGVIAGAGTTSGGTGGGVTTGGAPSFGGASTGGAGAPPAGGSVSGGSTATGGVAATAGGGSTSVGGTTGGAANGTTGGAANGGAAGNASSGAGGSAGSAGSAAGGSTSAKGLGACLLPTGSDFAVVQANYEKWKADLLTADGAGGYLRVRRPNSGTQVNSSNSEGIAYGMEISVYMDDQTTFDQLWNYEQHHLGANQLMEWEIGPNGDTLGQGAASDGDEDMAFALVMADKKWGGKGALPDTYLNYAKKQIDLIWEHEVDHTRADVLMPGDQFADGQVINISYFAPAYYRVFGQVTGKTADWNRAAQTSYDVIEATLNASNKNASNGLIPAWSTPAGVPMAPPNSGHPTWHQLDSCRTPFRVAQDYCWFNEPRALAYLKKIGGFYSGIGAANIVDAYNLDGTVHEGATLHLAAFVGGAGVGAMATSTDYAKLRDDAYSALAGWQTLNGGSTYYNESWSMLSLLMMTGRFVDLTAN